MKNDIETLVHCPVCGEKYLPGTSRLIEGDGSSLFFHLKCKFCSASSLNVVSRTSLDLKHLTSMGMLTDLDFDEAKLFYSKDPISLDEVLDLCKSVGVEK